MVGESELWIAATAPFVGLIMSLLVGRQVSRDPILVSMLKERVLFIYVYIFSGNKRENGREINSQV
jgi:hypothetical protein